MTSAVVFGACMNPLSYPTTETLNPMTPFSKFYGVVGFFFWYYFDLVQFDGYPLLHEWVFCAEQLVVTAGCRVGLVGMSEHPSCCRASIDEPVLAREGRVGDLI